LISLISTSPLAFELVCKHTTPKTVGDDVRAIAELTTEQRETYHWKVAILTLNSAIKEPQYISAAIITLLSALNMTGMLA
jgi:hypothetical protein